MNYEKIFNEKIDSFKGHIKYPWLRKEADAALSNRSGFGLSVIISDDFMDRIVAMPTEYIQDWLDGKNKLEWRREDELMLNALKGDFVDLHAKHPNVEIHKIGQGSVDFYKSLGFSLLAEKDGYCFVGKIDNKASSLSDQVESWKDVQIKYPMDREEMDEAEETCFVEDCFKLYEKEGFSSVFWSPFSDHEERKGQKFEVVGRCTTENRDLSTLPMWEIKFPNGEVIDAYPEEIIPSEMRANGCRWFDENAISLSEQIQSAAARASEACHTEKERGNGLIPER